MGLGIDGLDNVTDIDCIPNWDAIMLLASSSKTLVYHVRNSIPSVVERIKYDMRVNVTSAILKSPYDCARPDGVSGLSRTTVDQVSGVMLSAANNITGSGLMAIVGGIVGSVEEY